MNTILSTLARLNLLDQLYRAPEPIEPDGSNVPPTLRTGLAKLASGAFWVIIMVVLILVGWFALKAVASPKSRSANIRSAVAGLIIASVLGGIGVYMDTTRDFLDFYF